jgi:hypothetical protein
MLRRQMLMYIATEVLLLPQRTTARIPMLLAQRAVLLIVIKCVKQAQLPVQQVLALFSKLLSYVFARGCNNALTIVETKS